MTFISGEKLGTSTKLRLLQVIGTLSRAYGGPVYSAMSLNAALGRIGCESHLLVLDNPPEEGVADLDCTFVGRWPGRYAFSPEAKRWLQKEIGRFDGVVVHGIWQFQSLLVSQVAPRADVPYLVFVHGALDPWFRDAYPLKDIKKRIYWRFLERRGLGFAKSVLFTAEEERRLAVDGFDFSGVTTAVVPYGIADPVGASGSGQSVSPVVGEVLHDTLGKNVLLFLSRLHRKKGLEVLVESFSRFVREVDDVHLVIAGPDEDGTLDRVLAIVESTGCSGAVSVLGMVRGNDKAALFSRADLFCLTSFSENFGLVVAEALAFQVPVLLSDRVNIWREVVDGGAGIVVEPTVESAYRGLCDWYSLGRADKDRMRTCAREVFMRNFRVEATAEAISKAFSAIETTDKGVL